MQPRRRKLPDDGQHLLAFVGALAGEAAVAAPTVPLGNTLQHHLPAAYLREWIAKRIQTHLHRTGFRVHVHPRAVIGRALCQKFTHTRIDRFEDNGNRAVMFVCGLHRTICV